MLALVPLLALAAATGPAGFYQAHQMEVGAALELSTNGRFRYQLDYGAVSESGEGRWTSDGKSVVLTSDPMPKAPAYVLLRDRPLPRGKLAVAVTAPESPYFDSLLIGVTVDGKPGEMQRIGKSETIDLPKGKTATLIAFVPVTGEAAGRFTLPLARGHRISLKFIPNDFDKARFAGQKLAIDHGGLLLDRYDVTIRFDKAKP